MASILWALLRRLLASRRTSMNSSGVKSFTYGYDADGNLAQILDVAGGVTKTTSFIYEYGHRAQ